MKSSAPSISLDGGCTLPKFIGHSIKRIRETRALTQQELAAKCELDRSYITLIEQGRKNPTMNILDKIGVVLMPSSAEFLDTISRDMRQTCASICKNGCCPLEAEAPIQTTCPMRHTPVETATNNSGEVQRADTNTAQA